jgi:hypothetical protein
VNTRAFIGNYSVDRSRGAHPANRGQTARQRQRLHLLRGGKTTCSIRTRAEDAIQHYCRSEITEKSNAIIVVNVITTFS